MKAGRRVVEGPEQARGDGEALLDFMSRLEGLDHQKHAAADNRAAQQAGRLRAVCSLGGLVRQDGRQARGQQHQRVERARPRVGVRRLSAQAPWRNRIMT